jgi:hypothetical protein
LRNQSAFNCEQITIPSHRKMQLAYPLKCFYESSTCERASTSRHANSHRPQNTICNSLEGTIYVSVELYRFWFIALRGFLFIPWMIRGDVCQHSSTRSKARNSGTSETYRSNIGCVASRAVQRLSCRLLKRSAEEL